MCLRINRELTKKYDGSTETYTFYKRFYMDYDPKTKQYYLQTPFTKHIITKPGIVKAKGELNIILSIYIPLFFVPDGIDNLIDKGACHAYIQRSHFLCGMVIPIQVKGQHIIAAGTMNDICFFEYEITQETWDKYVKE